MNRFVEIRLKLLFLIVTSSFNSSLQGGLIWELEEPYIAPRSHFNDFNTRFDNEFSKKKSYLESDLENDFETDQEKILDACLKNNWPLFFELYTKYKNTPHLLHQLCNPSEGPTPLLWATLSNNQTMIRLLLKHANRDNNFNESALYWAVRLEYADIVQILLKAGFAPDQTCKHYHKSLSSRTLRAKQIKQIIIRLHEKKVNYIESLTPIEEAMIKQNQVICSLLFQSPFKSKKTDIIEEDFENEIDCEISPTTALIITACPFLVAGGLYLLELLRLSENAQLPLSFDMTNYQ